MADTTIKQLIIGFVMFAFIVLSITTFTSFLGGSDVSNFNTSFNKFSQINSTISTFNTEINTVNVSENTDPSIMDRIGSVVSSTYNKATTALQVTTTGFSFMESIWGDAVKGMGFPIWVKWLPILLITLILVFGMIYYFTGVNG